jgi:hypothetical protein
MNAEIGMWILDFGIGNTDLTPDIFQEFLYNFQSQ